MANDVTKEMIQNMADAKAAYISAQARGMGVVTAKERMKNIAFNYYEQLLKAAQENISLREEIDALDAALADADKELKELRQIHKKSGKSQSTQSQTA